MANKKGKKVQIRRDTFLRIIREKGYTVDSLGEQPEIERSGKTIQRSLSSGEMSPDLLDRIGRFLDVDPTYLSGEYDRKFEEMKDSLQSPELTHYLCTKTDRYPYSKHQTEQIDYKQYLLDTLQMNNISKEQFLALDSKKKRAFQFDLGMALYNVTKQYFKVDSKGRDVEDFGMTSEGLTMLMGDWIKE